MPNVGEMFPSPYIRAVDLAGKSYTVTIKRVGTATIHGRKKWVVWFNEAQKGLPLNLTNAKTIADLAGSTDTDKWKGTPIKIFHDPSVKFAGENVGGIRVTDPGPLGGVRK